MSRPRGESGASDLGGGSTVSVTCVADGRCHSVPDAELATGTSRRGGQYAAICGHIVIPAPMVAPDGELCRACAERDVSHLRRRGLHHRS